MKTDLSIAIPKDTYARVAPRSGLAWKHFIDVGAGVVDYDYRGNVGVILFNHSDVDFEKPLRFGDRPLVRVTCFHLGRSSVGLRYRFFVDLEPRLEARMTVVATDLEQMAPVPVPDEFRRAFEALLETPDPDSP